MYSLVLVIIGLSILPAYSELTLMMLPAPSLSLCHLSLVVSENCVGSPSVILLSI